MKFIKKFHITITAFIVHLFDRFGKFDHYGAFFMFVVILTPQKGKALCQTLFCNVRHNFRLWFVFLIERLYLYKI